jgi:hypothetical protein
LEKFLKRETVSENLRLSAELRNIKKRIVGLEK